MRDLLLFLIVFGSIPLVLKRPAIGLIMFAWISLMNPHRLTFGAAYDFQFALLYAVVTIIGMFNSKTEKTIYWSSVTKTLLVFVIFMCVTTLFAQEPTRAWKEFDRVMKTMAMIFLTIAVVRTEKEIKLLAWSIGLSIGFWGVKGGIFTIKSGGSNNVFGPHNTYIGDNNALALALITVVPILIYLRNNAPGNWIKWAMTATVLLSAASALGSYSRGALIAAGAMLGMLWLKSHHKIRTAIIVGVLVPLVYEIMPAQWFDRMGTIENYEEDSSAMGRVNAWWMAFNLARDNVLGGGFDCFSRKMFSLYAPDPLDHHAAHSIYFQVLGEHGFIGLFLFLLFLFLAWRNGSRVIKLCKDRPELKWAGDLARMCQVSLVGYSVGGAFLTLAYYDLPYYIITLLVVMERLITTTATTPTQAPATTPGPGHPVLSKGLT